MTVLRILASSVLTSFTLAIMPFVPRIALGAEAIAQSASVMARQRKFDDFKSAKRCLEAMTTLGQMQQEIFICNFRMNDMGVASRNECQAKAAELSRRAKSIDENAVISACSRDPQALSDKYNAAVRAAAEAGNFDAQVCFVQGAGGQGAVQVDVPEYRARAGAYLNHALDRGDWRAVELLSTSPMSIAHGAGMLVNLPEVGKWETAYGALKLLRLGAVGDYAKSLDGRLAEAAHWLGSDKVRAAEQWARDMYRTRFSDSPKLTADPVPCLASYQTAI